VKEQQDLYRVLQVDPEASYVVIQAAYRALARVFHPDVEGDDEDMKRLNGAWNVLGDRRRRAAYDAERQAARKVAGLDPAVDRAPARPDIQPTPAPPFVPVRSEEGAGPPPGRPSGPVLDYGRYKGWSLGEIARVDRQFLEWMRRVPGGRSMRADIDIALEGADWGIGLGGRPVVREAVPVQGRPLRARLGLGC
jgi:curved DNA-binding protein CbpA